MCNQFRNLSGRTSSIAWKTMMKRRANRMSGGGGGHVSSNGNTHEEWEQELEVGGTSDSGSGGGNIDWDEVDTNTNEGDCSADRDDENDASSLDYSRGRQKETSHSKTRRKRWSMRLCGDRDGNNSGTAVRPPIVVIMILIFFINQTTVVKKLAQIANDPISHRAGIPNIDNTNKELQRKRIRILDDDHDASTQMNSTARTLLDRHRDREGKDKEEASSIHALSSSKKVIPDVSYDSPTFEEIKKAIDDGTNPTAGQHLLDFGIIGFPKCGTTTMMNWLGTQHHPQLGVIQQEIMALQKNHPARILRFIVKELPPGRILRGYKSPNDIEDQRAINKLAEHYPKTKLMIGIRHPVLWFESFYNHRVQNAVGTDEKQLMPPVTNMTRHCFNGNHGVCFHRSAYHMNLLKLGKTPLGGWIEGFTDNINRNNNTSTTLATMDDPLLQAEFNVFSNREQKLLKKDGIPRTLKDVTPNEIFLYDTSQLASAITRPTTSTTVAGDSISSTTTSGGKGDNHDAMDPFRQSLHQFLGLSPDLPLPPVLKSKPGKIWNSTIEQEQHDALKINICDVKYDQQRQWLLDNAQRSSKWIRTYFVKNPHVTVAENPISFERVLDSYMVDPCIERRKNS